MTSRFWIGFTAAFALLGAVAAGSLYSPGEDHLGAIPVGKDPSSFLNYEVGYEVQDPEILFHEIGRSIENARAADIIFVGWSRLVFAMDPDAFDAFSRKHHVRMYNLGLAGVPS